MQPSQVVSTIAFWFVFERPSARRSTLGIEALQSTIASVIGYLPNVVAAVLIMLVAVTLAMSSMTWHRDLLPARCSAS